MKKKILKQLETYEYQCESCGDKIEQDGKNISLILDPEKKFDYIFHFHTSCLVEHLRKTWIPNP